VQQLDSNLKINSEREGRWRFQRPVTRKNMLGDKYEN